MTNKKRKPIKRNLRWLYPALLKKEGERVDVRELVGFYDEYEAFRQKVVASRIAPATLKGALPPINKPKYVRWAESFLVDEEKE